MRSTWAQPVIALALGLSLAIGSVGLTATEGFAQEGTRDASAAAAFVGGVVGGTVGLFAGAYVGSQGDCDGLCGELFSGALVGEVLGVALGAHAFNEGRGSLLKDLGTSAGVVGFGLVASALTGSDGVFTAALVGQLVAVSVVEVRTSPWAEPTVAAQRTPHGTVMQLGLRLRQDFSGGPHRPALSTPPACPRHSATRPPEPRPGNGPGSRGSGPPHGAKSGG